MLLLLVAVSIIFHSIVIFLGLGIMVATKTFCEFGRVRTQKALIHNIFIDSEQVDIDEDLLNRYQFRVKPFLADYLKKREHELVVDVYHGSIDTYDSRLVDTDVVVGVEIIEHLYPDTIENLPYNIFEQIHPKIIIFTTPNSEFNVVFGEPRFPTGFRHDDHKFEWTRDQFHDWAHNLCVRYPDYQVEFYDIGPGPPGTEHLGCVSQLSLFIRKDFLQKLSTESIADDEKPQIKAIQETYKLMYSVTYPAFVDDRNRTEKIIDEVKYHVCRFYNMEEEYYDSDGDVFRIPLSDIFSLIVTQVEVDTVEELKEILIKSHYEINAEDVMIIDYNGRSEIDEMECEDIACDIKEVEIKDDAIQQSDENIEDDW